MKEITNVTTYNKNTVKNFLEVYFFERIKVARIILNIFVIIMVISFFTNKDRKALDIITLIFSLLAFIEINTSMIPNLNYYKLTKSKDSILNTKVKYVFKEYNFELNKTEYIDYKNLKKVIETNTAYYLFLNNSKSLIVDKNKLKEKEINILTDILKKQVSIYKYK